MADLGTLWFGADIDLTKLKQKINSGNQSVLDALKMNYDEQSYQQMVSKLRTALDRETFKVKIVADENSVAQNLRRSLSSAGGRGFVGNLDEMNAKILAQTEAVNRLKERLLELQTAYNMNKKGTWAQQMTATGQEKAIASLKAELAGEQRMLRDMIAQRQAYRNSTQDNLLALRQERAEQQKAAAAARQAMNERRAAIRQYNSDHIRLNTTLANGIHISTQLGSALSSLFAIHQARQFLGNVIEIGGQLEKQRISIGAILGDTVKANHLFEQIKGLALKSPFGVVELDQYTKQLSAYGFKYNELFDMTKRLADISAGAGTDIGRLTLALGHVRSATYLTGITLRQFSMNNIPMLKMLADYYTEVEKKAVSTADVQKRISKRQVSYEDVIEQIRRLTDEGGMFYNMQEKISDSLAARYKNLKDAMDIMYGEIAEGTVGDVLKGIATELLKLTRHWREIAAVMGVAGAAWLLGRTRLGLLNVTMQGNTAVTMRKIMADKQLIANNLKAASTYRALTTQERILIASKNSLTAADLRQAMAVGTLNKEDVLRLISLKKLKIAQAMHLAGVNGITAAEIRAAAAAGRWKVALAGLQLSLKNAFMGVGPGTWATLGLMAGTEMYMAYSQWTSKIEEKANEMKDIIKSRVTDLGKMQKQIDSEGKPKDSVALKNRVEEMKQVLANSEAYTKTLDEQLSKAGGLNEQYDILAKTMSDVAEANRKALDYQDEAAKLIKASSLGDRAETHWYDYWTFQSGEVDRFFFNDDINKNVQQLNDSYAGLRRTLEGLYEFKEPLKELIDEMMRSGDVSESLKDQMKNAPFEEQLRLLVENGYWEKIQEKLSETGRKFSMTDKEVEDASKRMKESFAGVAERWNEITNDDVTRMFQKLVELRGGDEKEVRQWALDNIDDVKRLLDGVLDQVGEKSPAIRRGIKQAFFDLLRLGQLSDSMKGLAEGGAFVGDVLGGNEKLQKLIEEAEKADLHDDNSGSSSDKKDKGNKKDEQLEGAKARLEQYKSFLSEYKKYREQYGKEQAIDMLASLFPDLKDEKGRFLGSRLVDNYIDELDKLRNTLPATTEARKKFKNDIDKTKADTLFDREKETLKKNADAMEEYIKRLESQWKEYQSLLKKSGGNREFAQMAFTDGMIWDETAKKMLERFNERGEELGVVPVGIQWDMNEEEFKEALRDEKGLVQTELVDLAKKIQEVIRGNYKQFLTDSAEAYNKSLTAAQKLVELERQRNEIVEKRDHDNDQSPEKQKGWNAQIASFDKQIASQRWEAFKETEQWGRIFSNLDNLSTQTLEHMLKKLRELAPTIADSTEGTKALYEAIDKIQDKLTERNPFAAVFGAVQRGNRLRQLYDDVVSKRGSFTPDARSAKYYGLQEGRTYTKNEIRDLIKQAGTDFTKGLEGLAAGFKAVQDVLGPVIDLFDALGNEDLSNFFAMGSNALGSAAQVASGLESLGLGAAGPYAAAAAAGLSVVSSLIAMHDKTLQKEIEASEQRQREMENLTRNLETALERTLGGIYNTKATKDMLKSLRDGIEFSFLGQSFGYRSYVGEDTRKAVEEAEKSRSYYDAAYASLLAQRDELQHQRDTELSKKNTDDEKIADYKQQLTEMDDEIKHFAEDMAKAIYDIDVKSWASDLGDALFEAWQKGEDGAEAFRKKASEIIADVAKKIAVTKLIETAMQPVLDAITSEMERTNGQLDERSIEAISAQMAIIGGTLPTAFNNLMDGLNAGMQKAGLEDMRSIGTESASSMTNSIKGVTETTADLLASYINAIRADVSVNRMTLTEILYAVQGQSEMPMIARAQLQQLEQVAANTQRNADAAEMIYEVLNQNVLGALAFRVK